MVCIKMMRFFLTALSVLLLPDQASSSVNPFEYIKTSNRSYHIIPEGLAIVEAIASTISAPSVSANGYCSPFSANSVPQVYSHLYSEKDARPGVRVIVCSGITRDMLLIDSETVHTRNNQSINNRDNMDQVTLNHNEMALLLSSYYDSLISAKKPHPWVKPIYKLTACLPALFHPVNVNNNNDNNDNDSESNRVRSVQLSEWISRWIDHARSIGVEHFYLYTIGKPIALKTREEGIYTWIDVSWVPSVKKRKKGMWYYGQYWTINDCLYRNKAIGTEWVLFQDYDEVFQSDEFAGYPDMIESVLKDNSGTDSIFFGNYIGESQQCRDGKPTETASDWKTCKRTRSLAPECRVRREDPYLCGTWKGRRKHVDRVDSVALSKVHKVLACSTFKPNGHIGPPSEGKECSVHEMSARRMWVDHYRGAPYNSTRQCICS